VMAYHSNWHVCRFCGAGALTLIRYGKRHYAHLECFLDAGHQLSELKPVEISNLPFGPLHKRGLLEEAQRLTSPLRKLKPLRPGELMRIVRGEVEQ
jgi:hypothetical protein